MIADSLISLASRAYGALDREPRLTVLTFHRFCGSGGLSKD